MASKQEHLYRLEEDLDSWLPRTGEMGRLLSGAAKGASALSSDIDGVESGLTIQEATTHEELEEIGYPADVGIDCTVNIEECRKEVLAALGRLSKNGSPEDMLSLSSTLLNVQKSNIRVNEVDGAPKFEVIAPLQAIDSEFGSTSDVVNALIDATAASYGVDVIGSGTLNYITPTERSNNNYDSSHGYATLDSNGNVTSGGTYSGYYSDN